VCSSETSGSLAATLLWNTRRWFYPESRFFNQRRLSRLVSFAISRLAQRGYVVSVVDVHTSALGSLSVLGHTVSIPLQQCSWPPLWSSGQSSWLRNGDVLWFQWGTNWIYICYVEESRPPLWSSSQSSWLHNGDVLWFQWGTNWIYLCYVEESRPPLWSSGQSSWLHNGDVLWFQWGKNWIYICYVEESRPPLWSSGQSS
jgi:hypothetical protein